MYIQGNLKSFFPFILLLALYACGSPEMSDAVTAEYENISKKIDFNQDVKPILSDKCFLCHGPDKNKIDAGLQLHLAEIAYAELPNNPGKVAIKPGNPNKSELVHRILTDDPSFIMPKPESHLSLTAYEKAVLIKWIDQGAEYQDHWAFIKPKPTDIPESNSDFIINPIDNFVLNRLAIDNMEPAPKASKEILLRRLSFDLTGLPPTIEELDNFINDNSPNAYEKQVDRLLASPHNGEQLALDWMDLSRFADTHGYSIDGYRDMSPWRDWVIKAFQENMPYDQFVTWQLAGDLLDNPTTEMKLATAFNRIHPNNGEGGIVNEEFLVEYAVDRISTASQAFMGLTVACARCHDHKYDPISQKNFYEMTSYFNNINESGQISWYGNMPVPTLLLPTKEQDKTIAYLQNLIDESESEIKKVQETEIAEDFKKWLNDEQYNSISKTKSIKGLVSHFDLNSNPPTNKLDPKVKGEMVGTGIRGNQLLQLVEGKLGKGVQFNGDVWLDLKKTGVFGRDNSFTVGLWANIPKHLKNGNIFHKGNGAILVNWRGYHLKIVGNKLEVMLANTAPANAIIKTSVSEFPRDEWVHLAITYNGSSKASGVELYINGEPQEMITSMDDLYRDILFRRGNEPGLQLGARWRGKGIKGGIVDEIKVFNRELSALEMLKFSENKQLNSIVSKNVTSLSQIEKTLLQDHYILSVSKRTDGLQRDLAKLKKSYVDSVEKVQEVMVMKETKEPVQSYLLERGDYTAKGEKVYPGILEAILPMPNEYPKNRLGLSKWLFHTDHPLTARVAVNRYWQHYFGNGLVKTSEDFGNQGEMPSHPKLLDWLSLHFMESGWDVKGLQKLIVMSGTYQQSSTMSDELFEKDRENRLLARGPSKRLTGEMLRNNALASSGLLNKTIGGESVKPYQPQGLWRVNNSTYKQDTGENLYRKSMYTIWKRSVPHPTIATFDAPTRSVCTIRRQETNTPLQALVLMNDPTYIEAARVLGMQMLSFSNQKEAISSTYRKLTGKLIQPAELDLLMDLQKGEHQKFKKNTDKAKGWINTGEFKLNNSGDAALVAANAVVASTIMNSDATITKR